MWITRGVKHKIYLKKGIYRKIKNTETRPTGHTIELSRLVKKNKKKVAKKNFKIKIAREEKISQKRL